MCSETPFRRVSAIEATIGDALKWQIETIREHVHQLEESLVEFELMRL